MDYSVEEQMLNTMESLHYVNRFRDKLFACILGSTSYLEDIFMDLRVFYLAQIRTVIFCREDDQLHHKLESWNPRGYKFSYIGYDPNGNNAKRLLFDIAESLARRRIPVIAIIDNGGQLLPPSAFHEVSVDLAGQLAADKMLLLGPVHSVELNGSPQSHLSRSELTALLDQPCPANLSKENLLFLSQQQKRFGSDIVILESKSGCLFQEVFTHLGSGTLFSDDYSNVFRQAQLRDSRYIALLMRPYTRSKAILPINEDEIAGQIESFYLYTVNDQIVAAAKLTEYQEGYEIGKLATLPRYQRKGRAKRLIERLIEKAAQDGKKFVFALTTEEQMGLFFERCGLKEVKRESLPQSWQDQYDFSRKSRAYLIEI